MGFSLQAFFAELFEIINQDLGDVTKFCQLHSAIEQAAKYAGECGCIEDKWTNDDDQPEA